MEKDYQQNNLINFLHKIMVVSIGPFTADELKKYNVENQIAKETFNIGKFGGILGIFESGDLWEICLGKPSGYARGNRWGRMTERHLYTLSKNPIKLRLVRE